MDPLQEQLKKTLNPTALKALGKIVKKEINGEKPHQLKVDCTTALEFFFLIAGIVVAVLFFTGIFIAQEEEELWPYVWGCLGLSLFLFLCRAVTDNYYVLDKQQFKIFIHRTFAGIHSEVAVCEFSEIFAVLPVARMMSSKTGTYWMYHLAVLLQNGRFIRISDANTAALPEALGEPGREIASWLGVPFIPGREKEQVKVISTPVMDEGALQYVTEKELRKQNLKLALIIIAVSLVLPLVVIFVLLGAGLF